LWRLESRTDAGELGCAAGVRQKAKVTDAAEALRQDVKEKATDELLSVERHRFGFVAGAIIFPREADTAMLASEEPAVIDPTLQKVSGEGMPKSVGRNGFAEPSATPCAPACGLDCAGAHMSSRSYSAPVGRYPA
jgi:hypothetical protein